MHYKQLVQTLYAPLEELGYKKVGEYTWMLQFDELSIASTIVKRDAPPRFDIILGVVYDMLEKEFPLEDYRLENVKIETTLYELLLSLGEPEEHLNKLFYNNVNEPTEGELKNNIPAIMDLFKKKIIPYFENWNDYYWLVENFEERINNEKFIVYGPLDFLNFFCEQLEIKLWIKENC
jgi:hypothetical protein